MKLFEDSGPSSLSIHIAEEEEEHQLKKHTPKRPKIEQEEDRISALPDCLIIQILSLLPSTEDAIRTGTLSKRWESLWTSIATLIFRSYSRDVDLRSIYIICKTLTQCSHSKLNKFELHITFEHCLQPLIIDCIRYAISRRVEILDLTLSNLHNEHECLLPQQIFNNSCITDLRLEGFFIHPIEAIDRKMPEKPIQIESISWKMLRKLYISRASLDEHLIDKMLSGSPVLETLELNSCYGYERLDITSKSVKNLVFCGFSNPLDDDFADVIAINAPNILSLKIQGHFLLSKISLLDVSSLVEAELNYKKYGPWEGTQKEGKEETLKGFIQRLRHVKELKVGTWLAMVVNRLEAKGFSFPPNMTFPNAISPWSSSDDSD